MPVWKIFNINKQMSPWMLTFAVFEFLDGHNLICFLQQIKRRGCIRGLCPQSKHFVILTEMVKIKWLLLYGLQNFQLPSESSQSMRNINQYEEIIELMPFYFQIGFKIVISYFQAQPLSSGYPLTLNLNEISRQRSYQS